MLLSRELPVIVDVLFDFITLKKGSARLTKKLLKKIESLDQESTQKFDPMTAHKIMKILAML